MLAFVIIGIVCLVFSLFPVSFLLIELQTNDYHHVGLLIVFMLLAGLCMGFALNKYHDDKQLAELTS